jgi:Holliday junction resolvase RusA-like endonuclease
MTRAVYINVPGEPVAKGRPRFSTIGKFPRAYTPKKTADYETQIREYAALEMRGSPMFDGPVVVRVVAWLAIPKSWSKKRRATACLHTSKPDADNFLKAAIDGLNGIVFKDDSQAVDLHVSKRYSETPHLAICVQEAP